ncbi:hydroxyethylthiazole kinase [Weissella cibaria]|uniref:hydroxyethylthiazole kinase n=1 Tax=Weissella cibaria TaxID=137591 RepID=UPI001C1F6362|nr:hydroxyethylthiazole kinase [Weissella cibaria]MBU7562350.1 hydroxyethylthiazole kinase [Weissella cibaria]
MTTLLTNIREQQPLVLNVANLVTMQRVADAINVLGASPLMTDEVAEAEELVSIADAVVLNTGTLSEARWPLFVAVGQAANRQHKPVVLDPVAVGMPYRAQFVTRLLDMIKVDVIRGNAAEIGWFAGVTVAGQGIDAHDTDAHVANAVNAAQQTGATIVQTGVIDVITDGQSTRQVTTNSPLLAVNVGAGDMLSGIVGAFVAVTDDYLLAGETAAQVLGQAGEQATAQGPNQPGTFVANLFDNLYQLAQAEVIA